MHTVVNLFVPPALAAAAGLLVAGPVGFLVGMLLGLALGIYIDDRQSEREERIGVLEARVSELEERFEE